MALRSHGSMVPRKRDVRLRQERRNVVAPRYSRPVCFGVTLATTVPYDLSVFGVPVFYEERLVPVVQRLQFERSLIGFVVRRP